MKRTSPGCFRRRSLQLKSQIMELVSKRTESLTVAEQADCLRSVVTEAPAGRPLQMSPEYPAELPAEESRELLKEEGVEDKTQALEQKAAWEPEGSDSSKELSEEHLPEEPVESAQLRQGFQNTTELHEPQDLREDDEPVPELPEAAEPPAKQALPEWSNECLEEEVCEQTEEAPAHTGVKQVDASPSPEEPQAEQMLGQLADLPKCEEALYQQAAQEPPELQGTSSIEPHAQCVEELSKQRAIAVSSDVAEADLAVATAMQPSSEPPKEPKEPLLISAWTPSSEPEKEPPAELVAMSAVEPSSDSAEEAEISAIERELVPELDAVFLQEPLDNASQEPDVVQASDEMTGEEPQNLPLEEAGNGQSSDQKSRQRPDPLTVKACIRSVLSAAAQAAVARPDPATVRMCIRKVLAAAARVVERPDPSAVRACIRKVLSAVAQVAVERPDPSTVRACIRKLLCAAAQTEVDAEVQKMLALSARSDAHAVIRSVLSALAWTAARGHAQLIAPSVTNQLYTRAAAKSLVRGDAQWMAPSVTKQLYTRAAAKSFLNEVYLQADRVILAKSSLMQTYDRSSVLVGVHALMPRFYSKIALRHPGVRSGVVQTPVGGCLHQADTSREAPEESDVCHDLPEHQHVETQLPTEPSEDDPCSGDLPAVLPKAMLARCLRRALYEKVVVHEHASGVLSCLYARMLSPLIVTELCSRVKASLLQQFMAESESDLLGKALDSDVDIELRQDAAVASSADDVDIELQRDAALARSPVDVDIELRRDAAVASSTDGGRGDRSRTVRGLRRLLYEGASEVLLGKAMEHEKPQLALLDLRDSPSPCFSRVESGVDLAESDSRPLSIAELAESEVPESPNSGALGLCETPDNYLQAEEADQQHPPPPLHGRQEDDQAEVDDTEKSEAVLVEDAEAESDIESREAGESVEVAESEAAERVEAVSGDLISASPAPDQEPQPAEEAAPEAAPAAKENRPPAEEVKPAEEAQPAAEETKPAAEEAKPAEDLNGNLKVQLERNAEESFGFTFKRAFASTSELTIEEVLPEGAMADFNRRQTAAGIGNFVILPHMRIVAVNDVQGDAKAMADRLRSALAVELQISPVMTESRLDPQSAVLFNSLKGLLRP